MNSVANFFISSSGYMHGSRSLSISWLAVALIAVAAVFSTVRSTEAGYTICRYSEICAQYPPAPWENPWFCGYAKYNLIGQKVGCGCFQRCR